MCLQALVNEDYKFIWTFDEKLSRVHRSIVLLYCVGTSRGFL